MSQTVWQVFGPEDFRALAAAAREHEAVPAEPPRAITAKPGVAR